MVYRNYTTMQNAVIRVKIIILSHKKLSISIQMEDRNRESDVKVLGQDVKVLGHDVKVLGHDRTKCQGVSLGHASNVIGVMSMCL